MVAGASSPGVRHDEACAKAAPRELSHPDAASRRLRLHEKIQALLTDAIAKGSLRPGDVLREGALVDVLGSTRGPVRQALGRLHDDGIVRRVEGVGHVVGDDAGQLREIDLPTRLAGHVDSDPIRKAPGWERVYEQVERAVIHRAAFGRAWVNEIELARHHGVGRLIARDVLTRLELLGMLEKEGSQRWRVVPLDGPRVSHLNELRGHIEPEALRRGCDALPHARLRAMRERVMREIESYPRVDATTMNALENDLHVECLAGCPNKEMLAALHRTHCVLTLSKHVLGTALPIPDEDPFLEEHLVVFDRLLDGDIASAVSGLARHLASATPKVIRRLATFRAECKPPAVPFLRA